MAVWADLGDDDEHEPSLSTHRELTQNIVSHHEGVPQLVNYDNTSPKAIGREDHNDSSVYIAQALRCYPIAEKLASHLDLTDLDALSTTCHAIRHALVQFAYQLKQHSLRCSNEEDEEEDKKVQESRDEALAQQMAAAEDDVAFMGHFQQPAYPLTAASAGTLSDNQFLSALGIKTKLFPCARDLVAPCRNCGLVICRNCAFKAPSNKYLNKRLRRLCEACQAAPLIYHKMPDAHQPESASVASSTSSARSVRSDSDSSDIHYKIDDLQDCSKVESLPHVLRESCTCASKGVYLCQGCGGNSRSADSIYERVWQWRSRYSTHIGGGLGTGLGLGDQGQKCGRAKMCLATHDAMALMETECSEDAVTPTGHESSRAGTPDVYNEKPGYFRQEIEGIGGNLKSKSKRIVKVGATVFEFPDERQTGKYLAREINGELRSWCSWCSRVCPGAQDQA